MLPTKVRCCLEGGTSILVGTADAASVPATCRGVALQSENDCQTLTVYVPVATGQETIANVASTRRIAVAASHPISHETVQFKGTLRAVRVAKEEEAALVRSRMEQFAAVVETIGMPRSRALGVAHWPAYAIEFQVEEMYDQTPGPSAGTPLT